MKLVAQMDEISSINIKTDSTFAVLLEAQNRGHEIFYYTANDLNFDVQNQKLSAEVRKIKIKNEVGNHVKIIETKEQNLTDFDVILVRQDPPFDLNYITSCHLLEKIKDQILILNNPSEIRNCPEKIFVTDFPDLMTPTIISSSLATISNFHKIHGDIILKPLYHAGGSGITRIKPSDTNLISIFEMMMELYKTPIMAQKFLPEVRQGDNRIILVNGVAVGGIGRIPKEDENRSNFHVGGMAAKIILSKRQLEICEKIGPELKKRGLFFVGIDVIGDYVTEINVTSPTGIKEINAANGGKVEEIVVKGIEEMLGNCNP